jgi:hypothetical protein
LTLFSLIFATGLRQRSTVNIGALHNIAVFNIGADACVFADVEHCLYRIYFGFGHFCDTLATDA